MLLFSMVVEIKESFKTDDFLRLVLKWNDESIHEENKVKNIEWNGNRNIHTLCLVLMWALMCLIAAQLDKIAEDYFGAKTA